METEDRFELDAARQGVAVSISTLATLSERLLHRALQAETNRDLLHEVAVSADEVLDGLGEISPSLKRLKAALNAIGLLGSSTQPGGWKG